MFKAKYLGLDLGLKKIGVAISTSGVLARPLPRILVRNQIMAGQVGLILKICQEYQITHLIIGYPLHHSKKMSTMCRIIDQFVVDLKCHPNFNDEFKIILQNESFTSQQAITELELSQVKKLRVFQLQDSIAACLILECYFKKRGIN